MQEYRDRMFKENNLVIFNVVDYTSDHSSITISLVNDIFKESSSPILLSYAKRLGKLENRLHLILVQINLLLDVHTIVRDKSNFCNNARRKYVSISMDLTVLLKNHRKSLRLHFIAKRNTMYIDCQWRTNGARRRRFRSFNPH